MQYVDMVRPAQSWRMLNLARMKMLSAIWGRGCIRTYCTEMFTNKRVRVQNSALKSLSRSRVVALFEQTAHTVAGGYRGTRKQMLWNAANVRENVLHSGSGSTFSRMH